MRFDERARNDLRELAAIRPVAVKETSYYPALSNLFNEIRTWPETARAVRDSSEQHRRGIAGRRLVHARSVAQRIGYADLISKVPPSRGVIEAKGTGDSADTIAKSPQVAKYLERYGQVLVTTLRDFVLVGKTAGGKATILERYAPRTE